MSALAAIEAAIEHLAPPQLDELAAWLEQRRLRTAVTAIAVEPDFLSRAKAIWGETPAGKQLSDLILESRN